MLIFSCFTVNNSSSKWLDLYSRIKWQCSFFTTKSMFCVPPVPQCSLARLPSFVTVRNNLKQKKQHRIAEMPAPTQSVLSNAIKQIACNISTGNRSIENILMSQHFQTQFSTIHKYCISWVLNVACYQKPFRIEFATMEQSNF